MVVVSQLTPPPAQVPGGLPGDVPFGGTVVAIRQMCSRTRSPIDGGPPPPYSGSSASNPWLKRG